MQRELSALVQSLAKGFPSPGIDPETRVSVLGRILD